MSDEQSTASTPPTEPPLTNSAEARTQDGTIKDQQSTQTPPESTATDKSTTTAEKETKPAETKPAETKAEVPDKYDFKAPEGFELKPDVLERVTPAFKELGLTNDQGQKLVDLYAAEASKIADNLYQQFEETKQGWRKEVIGDKAVGNGTDGLSPEAKQNIDAAITSLPAELQQPFKEAMDLTGAGDHPAFVRAMNILGQQFREGKGVSGGKPSPLGQQRPNAPTSAAQAMYPNLKSSVSQS